ncbi:MAG: hypothetical protein CMD12_00985 [Flavobacteriales bacterium]|nr:hypothetical protein [Flavobacteriales bacterium]
MIFFWFFYYLTLILLCYLFANFISNKFLKFFFIPFILSIFGSFWFIEPGSNELAPIISILFLENFILDSNGVNRLLRPLISFIFISLLSSLIYYFYTKNSKN